MEILYVMREKWLQRRMAASAADRRMTDRCTFNLVFVSVLFYVFLPSTTRTSVFLRKEAVIFMVGPLIQNF